MGLFSRKDEAFGVEAYATGGGFTLATKTQGPPIYMVTFSPLPTLSDLFFIRP